jgi:hypothetical protein
MVIQSGSIVEDRGNFSTLIGEHVYQKTSSWNNLCQSKEVEERLVPLSDEKSGVR